MSKGLLWKGLPIEDLTRDEMIATLAWALTELRRLNSPSALEERALGRVEQIKRGQLR